jgi:N-methylhydantoinase A/oxoprolinase/acetone carboxylase beta subunit
MRLALGIDTGGTYTDAVIYDQENNEILCSHKALTTHRNLAIGIDHAISGVLKAKMRNDMPMYATTDLEMVGLSTTLATNAIVEGQGSPICLILIGYDPEFMKSRETTSALVTQDIVYIKGGHNGEGDESSPLDETTLRQAIHNRRDKVAAFAISGYFGVRNPEHELQAKALVEEITKNHAGKSLPVTCGHELTTKLNAIRRATTTALNASLIPVLRELIMTVRSTLDQYGIHASLMVVKGDGSLVRAEFAIQRPIETILSGPAASVVGAWHLAGREDMWVVDVGGTTTDIAVLRDGQPHLNPEGAKVGPWQTMVEAVDVHTVGLGGDSFVRPSLNGSHSHHRLSVGPSRVLPLCRLSISAPSITEQLTGQLAIRKQALLPFVGRFVVQRRNPINEIDQTDHILLDELRDGPVSLISLAHRKEYRLFLEERINRLTRQQLVMQSAFTPTDALHVLGQFQLWDVEAARLGAQLLAMQLGLSISDLCELVREEMSSRVGEELITKVFNDEVKTPQWQHEPTATAFLALALGLIKNTDLSCQLFLKRPVVAVGAPVKAYLPRTTELLHTELIIPEHAGIANALGAVVGSVVQRATALIRPIDFGERYRLFISGNLEIHLTQTDFSDLESCVAHAQTVIPEKLTDLAQQAGSNHVEIKMHRSDHIAEVQNQIGQDVFLETVLFYTAVGRPATHQAFMHYD